MAQFKVSEISESIVSGVTKSLAKILLPRVRKMIREEIDRGMKDVMLEVIKAQGATPLQESPVSKSTTSAKAGITQRQSRARDRARQIIERNGLIDDPLMAMVVDADDRQEEEALQMQQQITAPMVESKSIQPGAEIVDPSQIDFSDRLEKLGIDG